MKIEEIEWYSEEYDTFDAKFIAKYFFVIIINKSIISVKKWYYTLI